jgi:hypothetical protein
MLTAAAVRTVDIADAAGKNRLGREFAVICEFPVEQG